MSSTGAEVVLPISLRQVPTGERRFVDSAGRERYFHGTNVVVKGPPWLPATDRCNANATNTCIYFLRLPRNHSGVVRRSFSPDISLVDEDFERLQAMGITMMRFGLLWPALEPQRGVYKSTTSPICGSCAC